MNVFFNVNKITIGKLMICFDGRRSSKIVHWKNISGRNRKTGEGSPQTQPMINESDSETTLEI